MRGFKWGNVTSQIAIVITMKTRKSTAVEVSIGVGTLQNNDTLRDNKTKQVLIAVFGHVLPAIKAPRDSDSIPVVTIIFMTVILVTH